MAVKGIYRLEGGDENLVYVEKFEIRSIRDYILLELLDFYQLCAGPIVNDITLGASFPMGWGN